MRPVLFLLSSLLSLSSLSSTSAYSFSSPLFSSRAASRSLLAATCPSPSDYHITASNANGDFSVQIDLLNQQTSDLVESGVVRAFQYPGGNEGTQLGMTGLQKVDNPPAGVVTRYSALITAIVDCTTYDAHGVFLLNDNQTICDTDGVEYVAPCNSATGGTAPAVGAASETLAPPEPTPTSITPSTTTAPPTDATSTGSASSIPLSVCPSEGTDVQSSYTLENGSLTWYFDILTQTAADKIASFVERLLTPPAACHTGPFMGQSGGLYGYSPVTPTPDGVVARYEAKYGQIQSCLEYNGHIIANLKDGTQCLYGFTSVELPVESSTGGSNPDASNPDTTTTSTIAPSSTGSSSPPVSNPTSTPPPPVVTPPVITPSSVPPGTCPYLTYNVSTTGTAATGLTVIFTNTDSSKVMNFVNFHVSINQILVNGGASQDAPQYNFQMNQQSRDLFALSLPSFDDLQIKSVEYINYFFTYSADNTACDTEVVNYEVNVPTPPPSSSPSSSATISAVCPHITFTQSATMATDNSGGFTVQFDNTDTSKEVKWVDAHLSITSATVNGQFNYRMKSTSATSFSLVMPTIDQVIVPSDASVSYFFTYFVDGIGCNTDSYVASSEPPAAGGVCPALQFEPIISRDASGRVNVTFHVTGPEKSVSWVDLHIAISDALQTTTKGLTFVPEYNYRMTKLNNNQFEYLFPGRDGVTITETDYFQYFFTSNADRVACNSDRFQYNAQQAMISAVKIDTNTAANGGGSGGANQKANAAGATQVVSMGVVAISLLATMIVSSLI